MPQISRIHAGLLIALVLVVALVYWPGLNGGFVFDDFPNIVANTSLRVASLDWRDWIDAALSSPASSLPRPLAMLSFAVNIYFTGLDSAAMKLTNIAIHMVNTLLVFALLRRLLRHAALAREEIRADWTALVVAAIWALHPINLMSVLFVVQRMESLAHLFVFAGLWLYCIGRSRQIMGKRGWPMIIAGLVLFPVLGTLSKESAALVPLYAFAIELCIFRFATQSPSGARALKWMYVGVLALPAVIGSAWLLSRSLEPGAFASRDFTLAERLMTEPRVLMDYLRWILLPDISQMSLYHDDYQVSRGWLDPPTTIVASFALAAIAAAAWTFRSRWPLSSLGGFWFMGAHVLTATVIPLELVFEHRNYFASLGVVLVLADQLCMARSTKSGRRFGMLVLLAFTVACAGLTALRSSEWRSPAAFAKTEEAKHPRSPRATYYLGWMLATGSGYRADSPLVEPAFQAFDRARALPNSNILPDQGALILAARTGIPEQRAWWEHMQNKLREEPVGPQERGALSGLVRCTIEGLCHFAPEDMLATLGAALSQGPNPEVLSILGNYVLNALQDPDLALRLWQEASGLDPGEPQYRIGTIKLLIQLDRFEEAELAISRLEALGRLGRQRRAASELRARLAEARREHGLSTAAPQSAL